MSLKVDKLQLDIVINGDPGRAELIKLKDKAKELADAMQGMNKKSDEYIQKSAELKQVWADVDKIKNSFKLTDLTLGELTVKQRELNATIKNIDPNNPKLKEYQTELKEVKARMQELRGTAAETGNAFEMIGSNIKKWFGVGLLIAAGAAVVSFFKESVEHAVEYEARLEKLKFAVNNNAESLKVMTGFAEKMSKVSLFTKGQIMDAETMAMSLGRNEEQTKKMLTAAMGLSRVAGVDLNTAMIQLNMTYSGSIGRLAKYDENLKSLNKEQLESGEAVDMLAEKLGKFATSGLDTTQGRMVMFKKSVEEIQISFGGFALKLLGPVVNALGSFASSMEIALKSVKALKAEAFEDASNNAGKNAMDEIDAYQKKYEKNGMKSIEARKLAYKTYYDSVAPLLDDLTTKNKTAAFSELSDKEKEQLQLRLNLQQKELEYVKQKQEAEANPKELQDLKELNLLRKESNDKLKKDLETVTDEHEKTLIQKVIKEKDAAEKIKKIQDGITSDYNKAVADNFKLFLSDRDRQVFETHIKYEALYKENKNNESRLRELHKMEANEMDKINADADKKDLEDKKKKDKEEFDNRMKALESANDQIVTDENNKFLEKIKNVKGDQAAEKKLREEFNQEMRVLQLSYLTAQEIAIKKASKDGLITKEDEIIKLKAISDKKVQIGVTDLKTDEKKKESLKDLAEASAITAGKSIESALLSATSMQDAGKKTIEAIRQEIKALLAKAIALELVKDLAFLGPFALPVAGVMGAAVVALFDSLIPQFDLGTIDVIGASDGRKYNATPGGIATKPTIVSGPTLMKSQNGTPYLAGERMPEIIIDGPRSKNIMLNYPQLFEAIRSVPQYGNGNVGASSGGGMNTDPEMLNAIRMLNQHLSSTNFLVFDRQYKRFQKKVSDVESNFGTKMN